jgi:NADH-quinone oxidoreductase subunit A
MLTELTTVLAFVLAAWAVLFVGRLAGKLAGGVPAGDVERPEPASEPVPEEMVPPEEAARYWRVAIAFVLIDAALAFLWPIVVVVKRLVADGHGIRALADLFAFLGVLFFGFVHVWRKGDLAWGRTPDG